MGLVDATDPAAARIAASERLEVEPRFGAGMADSLEATAALGARDRGEPAVPDGEDGSERWIVIGSDDGAMNRLASALGLAG